MQATPQLGHLLFLKGTTTTTTNGRNFQKSYTQATANANL
ncbi:rCG32234 [Rattus norvegicus]|uniref:RCG32234 n=1 Tax=Rattus norvegicus TaxID=10116 RepID=A6JXG3_RAT|nr:rCG32234 [Rattus norvegicus]